MKKTLEDTACILAVTASLIVLAAGGSSAEAASPENVVLKNSVGQVSIAPTGAMRFTTKRADCPLWNVRSAEMWKITLAKGEGPFKLSDAISFTPGSENVPKFAATENGVELRYDSLRHGQQTWDIGLTLQVQLVGDEFEFLAKINSRADGWCVQYFKFPILFEIRKNGADHQELAVLLPSFLGERLATPESFGEHRRITYPQAARNHFSWWYRWATHSRLEPMIEKARMLKNHLKNILTYLKHGINSKIQWVKYIARGFRNFENFKNAIYFHCGDLDLVPKLT